MPYFPKKQAEYVQHLFFMPNNEVHGRLEKIQTGAPGVGKHMVEREQKVEVFRAQYPERYTGEANIEVHPATAGMVHNYNRNFSKMRISNVCELAGLKNTDCRV